MVSSFSTNCCHLRCWCFGYGKIDLGVLNFLFDICKIVHCFCRCRVCSQILPAFCKLSDKFPKLTFIYADIDECPETTQHIRYTPTFHFYRDGERVDEMFGTGEERLHDRLWLQS
ncbi:OLC1v1034488C3 [Oldenlandia corymbosa var. corymbosa]|uniref:OLC1v1034488C3 n=1 Tax=Oldenlandia corymbosa var. corymbosa TaxID=529605 RepID=A0AAV1CQX3_OLDCO|nr:OLC1v1034488C3 [Oldenlandia corymbosa var. corymbosa]